MSAWWDHKLHIFHDKGNMFYNCLNSTYGITLGSLLLLLLLLPGIRNYEISTFSKTSFRQLLQLAQSLDVNISFIENITFPLVKINHNTFPGVSFAESSSNLTLDEQARGEFHLMPDHMLEATASFIQKLISHVTC